MSTKYSWVITKDHDFKTIKPEEKKDHKGQERFGAGFDSVGIQGNEENDNDPSGITWVRKEQKVLDTKFKKDSSTHKEHFSIKDDDGNCYIEGMIYTSDDADLETAYMSPINYTNWNWNAEYIYVNGKCIFS